MSAATLLLLVFDITFTITFATAEAAADMGNKLWDPTCHFLKTALENAGAPEGLEHDSEVERGMLFCLYTKQ